MKIEKNIPLPLTYKSGKQVKLKYPINELKPKESFLIPAKTNIEKNRITRNICTIIYNWKRNYSVKERKFTTKAEKKGIRVWRIS